MEPLVLPLHPRHYILDKGLNSRSLGHVQAASESKTFRTVIRRRRCGRVCHSGAVYDAVGGLV